MKTVLIGLGRIGWDYHLKQIVSHDCFTLSAVVDTNTERLAEAKTLYGVKGYTDYRQMLLEEKPELVVIASPTVFHKEQAIAAMEAGADVLLDKPMAMDYSEACSIAQVQQKTGRKLVIYQPRRFDRFTATAKHILESGLLGNIYQIQLVNHSYARRDDWQAFFQYGGGHLRNHGAHTIDLLLYLSGSTANDFLCRTKRLLCLGDADDCVQIIMQTKNDIQLNIDLNMAASIPHNYFVIYGVYGTAELRRDENRKAYFYMKYCDPTHLEHKTASNELAAANRAYPQDQVDWIEKCIPINDFDDADFYAACEEFFIRNGPSPVPLEQTLHVMELIEKGYQQNSLRPSTM